MKTMLTSHCKQVVINFLSLQVALLTLSNLSVSSNESPAKNNGPRSSCSIYKDVGVNDLSVNDVVVKSASDNTICIKARFSLAIKVEAALENTISEDGDAPDIPTPSINETIVSGKKIVLGYLPLDSIVNVEDSCPQKDSGDQKEFGKQDEPQELDMIVTFECGKLAFTFRRDKDFYVSSIKGVVNLDSNTIREFISDRPVCYTSDLNHYFKFNEVIEVNSKAESKAFILTANLYHSEFEAFRSTSSRAFIRQPDDHSKPYR